MAENARVTSIDALRELRDSLAVFYDEAKRALDLADADLARALNHFQNELPARWKSEIARLERAVVNARVQLEQAQFAAEMGKSTIDERKKLRRLKEQLEHARRKHAVTKRWARALEREATIYRGQTQPLRNLVEAGAERPVQRLEQMTAHLTEYTSLQPPPTQAPNAPPPPGERRASGTRSTRDEPRRPGAPQTPAGDPPDPRSHAPSPEEARDAERVDRPPDIAITVSRGQRRELASMASAPPLRTDTDAILAAHNLDDATIHLVRAEPADAADSGWRIMTPSREPSRPQRIALHTLLRHTPALADILRLPAGWSVAIRDGTPEQATDPSGRTMPITMPTTRNDDNNNPPREQTE